MYDQSFKNQAVKECVNGQTITETARKYGVSLSALNRWIAEYKDRMVEMGSRQKRPAIIGAEMPYKKDSVVVKESSVVLNSVNIAVDGYDITMSKKDVVKLMEVFYHFDRTEGERDDD